MDTNTYNRFKKAFPETYNELNNEQKERYTKYKEKYPNLNEDDLVYLAYFGAERIVQYRKAQKSPIPTSFYSYTLMYKSYITGNFYGLYSCFNFKECIEFLEHYISESTHETLLYDEDKVDFDYSGMIYVGTGIEKRKNINFSLFGDYYVDRSMMVIYPDTTFVIPKIGTHGLECEVKYGV